MSLGCLPSFLIDCMENLVRATGQARIDQRSEPSIKKVFTGPTGITYSPATICVAAIGPSVEATITLTTATIHSASGEPSPASQQLGHERDGPCFEFNHSNL